MEVKLTFDLNKINKNNKMISVLVNNGITERSILFNSGRKDLRCLFDLLEQIEYNYIADMIYTRNKRIEEKNKKKRG